MIVRLARPGLAVLAVLSLVLGALLAIVPATRSDAVTCAPTWSSSATYVGGDTASKNGIQYRANWWTRGDDPVTHNGVTGTGQPWTSLGACGVVTPHTDGDSHSDDRSDELADAESDRVLHGCRMECRHDLRRRKHRDPGRHPLPGQLVDARR